MLANEMTGSIVTEDNKQGEQQTWLIPVGTEVVTKLGTTTTFARLSSGDTIQMLMQKDETENGSMYVDTMHLVPLELQDEYENALDVASNIVCLCPNCMAKMSNAKRSIREKMLVDMYYRKKQELSEAGIYASLAQVLTAQQCD